MNELINIHDGTVGVSTCLVAEQSLWPICVSHFTLLYVSASRPSSLASHWDIQCCWRKHPCCWWHFHKSLQFHMTENPNGRPRFRQQFSVNAKINLTLPQHTILSRQRSSFFGNSLLLLLAAWDTCITRVHFFYIFCFLNLFHKR